MKNARSPRGYAAAAALLALSSTVQAQFTLFSDSMDTGTAWTVNAQTAGDVATFGFDYSTVGIPASPNGGGSTIGLKLEANRPGNGVFSGVSVSPTGGVFTTGDYTLRFDLWQNFNGNPTPPVGQQGFPGGGAGSTQLSGAGIGTAGTTAQWAGSVYDSLFFATTGDGNSGQDYRVYPVGNNAGLATGYYAAGTGTAPDARNHNHPYYAEFGSVNAPAAQTVLFPQQNGTTLVGSQAFEWHDVIIAKNGNTVTWTIDGTLIATVDITTLNFGGNNILLMQSDINATSTDAAGQPILFGLFDNVRVTSTVPEPSTMSLMALAGAYLVARSRKQKR